MAASSGGLDVGARPLAIGLSLDYMTGEESIQFAEASEAFLCDEYYKNNFTTFLHANSIIVESSQRSESPASPESRDAKKLFVLKLTEESPAALQQEIGDAPIERFLAADEEKIRGKTSERLRRADPAINRGDPVASGF
jgi:hypothetical protein